ncbi:MAG: RNA polymerase sigma factor RpoE [Gammaproteobacteria bacterium]|nr:RNA polymerase sigma factor RpoE [Gammaproteobacteria bacterium]MCY4210910.1 RNA polymerase sigma factor RpoE [Gammaproteobacteria bacterium]MCY4281586.1 RNA polymerase sigma factor RpoE [Gammaproteobacteria bacterium]MCY4338459.1 RNA polymerase sigma factor RpoE [Gammaproteobacteria bacterium]
MERNTPDQILVERVKRGDKKAFDALVLKYQGKILGLVSRYVREPSDAGDVAQETFIKAYRALSGFRGDSAFYTWLYRIAINTAKNYLASADRRALNMAEDFDDMEQIDTSDTLKEQTTPERMLLTHELQETIITAIAELPADLRSAITLREIDGLSYEEIATAMDCPVGTVRSRIFRAREAVNKQIEPLLND